MLLIFSLLVQQRNHISILLPLVEPFLWDHIVLPYTRLLEGCIRFLSFTLQYIPSSTSSTTSPPQKIVATTYNINRMVLQLLLRMLKELIHFLKNINLLFRYTHYIYSKHFFFFYNHAKSLLLTQEQLIESLQGWTETETHPTQSIS